MKRELFEEVLILNGSCTAKEMSCARSSRMLSGFSKACESVVLSYAA